MPKIIVNFLMEPEMLAEVKTVAEIQDRPYSRILREAIRDKLEEIRVTQ